jgi:hypothetical protein
VKVARALIHKEFSISKCAFLVRAVLPFANWKRYFTIFKRGNSLLMILRRPTKFDGSLPFKPAQEISLR